MEMQQVLEELNERTYELFARLESNKEFLSEKQYAFMANVLHEQYKKSYEKLNAENNIEYRTTMYEIKQIVKLYVPRSFLGFKNKMATVITAETKEEFIKQYSERYAQLDSEQIKAERKQLEQEKRLAMQEEKRIKQEEQATQRRLKNEAKKRKRKPRKKDKKGK